jgi:predicted alpha/beta hydrolase family esterase
VWGILRSSGRLLFFVGIAAKQRTRQLRQPRWRYSEIEQWVARFVHELHTPATEEIFQTLENAIEFPLAWKVLPLP